MAASRADIQGLPFWPRGLSAEQAAAYVGVSVNTFLEEVKAGRWPAPQRRGLKGGRKIWDRRQIDERYDALAQPGTAELTDAQILERLD